VEITINGERKLIEPASVLGLLQELGIDPRRVAVELNREILPKDRYAGTPLGAGDSLEIVHFVGGG